MNRFLEALTKRGVVHEITQRPRLVHVPIPAGDHDIVARTFVKQSVENSAAQKGDTEMWLTYLVKALSALPVIVAGIEHIHGGVKSGVEKKQLAMEALGLSSFVAAGIDPVHAQAIAAATQLASQAIDGTVAVMNAAKEAPKPLLPPAPAL